MHSCTTSEPRNTGDSQACQVTILRPQSLSVGCQRVTHLHVVNPGHFPITHGSHKNGKEKKAEELSEFLRTAAIVQPPVISSPPNTQEVRQLRHDDLNKKCPSSAACMEKTQDTKIWALRLLCLCPHSHLANMA